MGQAAAKARWSGGAVLVIGALAISGCATRSACLSDPACTVPYPEALSADPVATGSLSTLQRVDVSPEVRAAQARVNAADEEIAKAEALGRPSAALIAAGGASLEHNDAYRHTYGGGIYSYALGLDIPIYQGGRTEAAVEAARAEARASDEAMSDRRIATAYELALALLRINEQRNLIAALGRQEEMLQQFRREVATEMAVGAASRVDLDDIDRQIARIRVISEQARQIITQMEQVTQRLGVPSNSRLPDAAALGIVDDEKGLVAIAMRNNPRIRERAARIEAARARITHAQGELLPTVTAGLRAAGEGGSLPTVDIRNEGRAEVRFSMPFDISGGVAANISQKSHEKVAADLEHIAAQDGVKAAVRAAVERRRQARRLLELARQERQASEAMLTGVRSERRVGERSVFDEIRSIENLTSAEVSLTGAAYDLRAAEYTIAAETGLITRLLERPLPIEPPVAIAKAPVAYGRDAAPQAQAPRPAPAEPVMHGEAPARTLAELALASASIR